MAKKKYLEESERKLIESVNNAYIPTDWDEFEKRYHEMERYGDGKPRKVDKEKMEYIEDGLVSRGIGGNQLSSLLSTIVEESGGNPFSVDDSRKFRGLIQFSKERYPEKDFDRDKKAGWKKAVDNQLDTIVDHLNEYGGDYGFLDGGDGSGYMTGEEAKDAFWGRDSDIENVTRALTYGFVRPGDRSGTTENRTRVARLINEIMRPPVEAPDILEFDYDGKHYKATKPEEVTPEMRRALMLSKLVGERNKVELQDPLYTTFDEAYGRAKGKGARVFMWNGRKYSTKEDGGEVKDMEKFGEVLESLYNEDVERVRNGERAQYFGVLNDKSLKNVYPEFDLISKPANMVYKGADMIANPISKVASSGASGFLEKELAGPVYWTKKLGDFMKALYLGATRPIFNSLPESAKPLARQVFKHLYQWRHFTLPDTVRLSRELFGGEDEPESFDAAFKAAREQGLDTFEWNGNEYSTEMKEEGGEARIPKRPDGGLSKRISEDDILALVLSSNANFVNRLKQEGRSTIPDWKVEGNIATHKLSAEIGEDGRVYVYPNVQEIDGKLKDFTDPKYGYSDEGRWDAMDSAIKHNDYVVFPDIESAVWFTENYKNKGWFPEFSDGGLSRLAPRDNTSVGHPGSAKVPPVMPSDVARDNPVISTIASFTPIIGEMLDIRDLYTSLKNNDKTGVLLALTGLIPVIGGVAGNVIKKNNPFWRKKIFSPEELAKDEELISKFPDYAHPNSPMGASVLNHEERLANGAFRKFRNIPAARVGVDSETGNIIYDFNGLDFNFIDVSNSDELKKVAEFYGTTPEEFISGLNKAPFFNYLDHVFIDRKLLEDMADTEELQFHFRDGVPPGSPQEEVLRSHEINHLVNSESKRESAEENGFSFDWLENNEEIGPGYDEYFRVNNNTEIAARGSQIKDYFGLTSPEQKITPEMLEYAARHYIFDYGVNNDMDLFFRSIKDYDKAAKWINKYATAGLGAYWLFDRTSSSDDDFLNGGPIKFARRLNGDSIFERNMISPWKTLIDKPEKKFPKRNIKMPDGGSYNLAPRDNTSVGRPGPADVQPVKPGAAARENPVVPFVASLMPGIGDVMDAHDFIEAARNKNMVGMALAAAGFIPLVGDAFQEAVRFARGRRNSYIRYDAPPRRNDITEGDEELLEKMPDYARPGYPAIEALNVHRRRLSDGAYEQRTGVTGEEAKRELEGFAETFPGIYDRIFDLDYINENDIDVARRVIELIDKRPKGSANTMSEEGVVKRLNEIKQSIVRSSPAFTEGTEGNSGIITLDNWSDFFMDEAYRSGISHELDHAVYLNTPKETIKKLSGEVGDWFDASKIENEAIRNYVSKPIELLARGTQIKDFYGLTNNAQKITPEMLKFAAKHYADNVMDNQMTEFFNGIKDWDKAAEWISKYSTATLPAIAVSKLLQDGKEKDEYPVNKRHGGPMSEDGSVGGDYILDDGGRSLYRRSEYIKNRLLSKYNLLPEESDGIISGLIGKSSLDEKFYDPRHKSYGIGQWSGKDLKEFVLTYKDGGLVDQIDFLAKKYWDGFGKDGKGDIESGVFNEHKWVVKRIGNEEFYTNSPLLKTLPSMSREDVALSLLPPELWPGVLKRKEDVTGKSARRHFIRGGEVNELQDYIYDRLTKEHGIAPIQAIGIVANLTQESTLNYDALGDNGRSYGIQQWQGDRRKNLFEFAKKRGRDKPALDDQVDFLVEEYKGNGFLFPTRGENMYKTGKTDKDMFDYFQYSKLDFDNAANIYDSTRAWAQGFGRGNKNFLNMDRRFHIAKTLSSRYNIDAGGQSFYTDMGYKDEWGSPIPEVAVSAEKKAAQDDWMEKYGNKMLASILAGDGEGGDTHVTNNYYVNEEGLSEDEKRNAAEVRELQQKQQAQELLASIIDGIKLDIKGVTEVRKR